MEHGTPPGKCKLLHKECGPVSEKGQRKVTTSKSEHTLSRQGENLQGRRTALKGGVQTPLSILNLIQY